MRIAFLVDALNEAGGTEISSRYLIKSLEKGHEVRTFLLHSKSFNGKIGSDTRRYCLYIKKGWIPFLSPKQTLGYFKDLAEFKPEMVIVTMTSIPFQISAAFLTKLYNHLYSRQLPVITIFRSMPCNLGDLYKGAQLIARNAACNFTKLAKFSTMVITNSYSLREAVSKTAKIKEDKIEVVYPPVETSLFKPIPREEAKKRVERITGMRLQKDQKVVVFAGRLAKEKGLIEFLNTVKELEKRVSLRFLVLGTIQNNRYKSELRSRMSSLGLSKSVVFVGVRKLEDMPYFYNCADLVVLPSIWNEPFGRTLAEAMACGSLVAGRRIGGIPEVIGNCGWLLPEKPEAKKEADLIEKILFLPKTEAEKIGRNARQRVESLFSEKETCAKFVSLVDKAAGAYK